MNHLAIQGQLKNTFAGYFSDVWLATVQQGGVGVQRSMQHVITTKLVSGNDHRGLKQSLQFPETFPNTPEGFAPILAKLTQPNDNVTDGK